MNLSKFFSSQFKLLALFAVLAPGPFCAQVVAESPPETRKKESGVSEEKKTAVIQGLNLRHYLSYDSTSRIIDEDVSEIQSFGDGLDLSNTEAIDSDLKQLRGKAFKDVKWLNLRGTGITDEGLQYLSSSPVKTLVLEDTEIDGSGFSSLKGLPLKYLTLEGTKITNESLAALQGLPLEYLDLTGTAVSDEGLRNLIGLPLQALKLYSTQITDAGLQFIPMLNLKKVYLTGTQVTPEGIESFQRRHGEIEVIY